jgi:hypothetical protein
VAALEEIAIDAVSICCGVRLGCYNTGLCKKNMSQEQRNVRQVLSSYAKLPEELVSFRRLKFLLIVNFFLANGIFG